MRLTSSRPTAGRAVCDADDCDHDAVVLLLDGFRLAPRRRLVCQEHIVAAIKQLKTTAVGRCKITRFDLAAQSSTPVAAPAQANDPATAG